MTLEEALNALEEAAKFALEDYRSFLDDCGPVMECEDTEELAVELQANVRRWYSVLHRAGRAPGDIPEFRTIEL